MFVMRVTLVIQLHQQQRLDFERSEGLWNTYQLKNCHLHHTLIEVSRLVLDHFDSHDLMGFHVLTFHHLTECSLTQYVQDQVPS